MKTLKLIAFTLLVTSTMFAQTYSAPVSAGDGGIDNVFLGAYSGGNATGNSNVFIGKNTGKFTSGNSNVFLGNGAGVQENVLNTGNFNTFTGVGSGQLNTSGSNNTFLGTNAGRDNTEGTHNVFLGLGAGRSNATGAKNIYLGVNAGVSNSGESNVFIGHQVAQSLTNVSDQLYIQNTNDVTTPLIYGDFATKQLGIGTSYIPTDPDTDTPYTLAINGKAIAEEVQVMARSTWPDYVFADDYELTTLTDLETQIETLGHLPGVPSAEEVETNGHALGRMDAILLEKIEELTLHLIDINKEVKKVRQENKTLKADLNHLQQENATLKNEVEELKK